jgi:hypothetical protein
MVSFRPPSPALPLLRQAVPVDGEVTVQWSLGSKLILRLMGCFGCVWVAQGDRRRGVILYPKKGTKEKEKRWIRTPVQGTVQLLTTVRTRACICHLDYYCITTFRGNAMNRLYFTAWVLSMWRYGHRPAGQQSLRSRSRRDLAFLVFLSLSEGPEERASCPCRYVDTRLRLKLCREWSSYSGDDRDDESQKAHLYPLDPLNR